MSPSSGVAELPSALLAAPARAIFRTCRRELTSRILHLPWSVPLGKDPLHRECRRKRGGQRERQDGNGDEGAAKIPAGAVGLIPKQAHDQPDQAFSQHGAPFTLSQFEPKNLAEIIDHLRDLTVDVHGGVLASYQSSR